MCYGSGFAWEIFLYKKKSKTKRNIRYKQNYVITMFRRHSIKHLEHVYRCISFIVCFFFKLFCSVSDEFSPPL